MRVDDDGAEFVLAGPVVTLSTLSPDYVHFGKLG